MTSVATGSTPDLFARDSERVLLACRTAFVQLIEALPGRIRSASDLQRTLRIDMKLAWQVHRFAQTEAVAGAVYMPGRPSVQKVIAAAKRVGLAPALLESLAEATDAFDGLVAVHAGDRATFDSMVSTHGGDDDDGLTLRQKRAAFRANRHLRGAQAAAQIKCLILRPSEQPGLLDLVAIQGYTDLRRVRHGGSLVVSRVRLSDDVHRIRQQHWEPLGPVPGEDAHASLLGPFCSPDLPPFRAVRTSADFVLGELAGQSIGNQAAVTCIDGYLSRAAVPRYRDESNAYGAMLTWVPIPCEVLVLDLVVHQGAFGQIHPVVGCYSTMLRESDLPGSMESCDRLPLNETAMPLGKGLPALASADLPRHSEMYDAVFKRLGWASEEFDVYRCRITFPLMLSSVLVRFDLPERPTP